MQELVDAMNKQLLEKGKEILVYKEKNPGCFGGGLPSKIPEEDEEPSTEVSSANKSSGILTGGKT
jgi:hypothetical protein